MSEPIDLLAALQRSIDTAKKERSERAAGCRFASLAEHTPSECPLCNPEDWMAKP